MRHRLQRSLQRSQPEPAELRTSILNAFESANQDVQGLGGGAAATLAVVEISPPRMATPVLTMVSQATRALVSWARMASRMASEI